MTVTNRPDSLDPCDELRDLLPAYFIGATTDAEAARVRDLLPRCPDVALDADTYAQITLGLMQQAAPQQPAPELRARLLANAAAVPAGMRVLPPAAPAKTRRVRTSWVAAALLILLLGSNIYWAVRVSRDSAAPTLDQAQANLLLDLFDSGAPQPIAVLTAAPERSVAVLYWNASVGTAALVTDDLPPLNPSQTYQVWLIGDDAPVSAGVFRTGEDQRGWVVFALPPNQGYTAAAISIEPLPGSLAPTSDPIAVGTIQS